jgi:hypothetical protein
MTPAASALACTATGFSARIRDLLLAAAATLNVDEAGVGLH